jgi:REP element-mobilizing transposase RayT
MPRKARIDAPGAVHHIIARGIERRAIFRDDEDRDRFVLRLGELVIETGTVCYAWALVPNHFHLLLKTGNVPVAAVMRRLLTGYAINFNRRHQRNGHVFQNRYKSILCEADVYLKELVRYIHLNPLRALQVKDIHALDRYRFSGHSCLIGTRINAWQNVDEVLALFSDQVTLARHRYHSYLKRGLAKGRRPDLVGGGLVRSTGGWSAVSAKRKAGAFLKSDERILGSSEFVNDALADAQETLNRRYALIGKGVGFDEIVTAVSNLMDLEPSDIVGPSKERTIVKARVLICYWAARSLGMSMTAISSRLKIAVPTVSIAVKKGRSVVKQEGLSLTELLNIKI